MRYSVAIVATNRGPGIAGAAVALRSVASTGSRGRAREHVPAMLGG